MTRILILAGVAAICSTVATAKPEPQLLPALMHVMQTSADQWNKGDLDGFLQVYERSPVTAFVTSKGVVKGFDAVGQLYRKAYGGPNGLGVLTYSDLSATPLRRDYAVLYGRFRLVTPGAPKDATGVFDLVMHKTPGGWRILSDHTS